MENTCEEAAVIVFVSDMIVKTTQLKHEPTFYPISAS